MHKGGKPRGKNKFTKRKGPPIVSPKKRKERILKGGVNSSLEEPSNSSLKQSQVVGRRKYEFRQRVPQCISQQNERVKILFTSSIREGDRIRIRVSGKIGRLLRFSRVLLRLA